MGLTLLSSRDRLVNIKASLTYHINILNEKSTTRKANRNAEDTWKEEDIFHIYVDMKLEAARRLLECNGLLGAARVGIFLQHIPV